MHIGMNPLHIEAFQFFLPCSGIGHYSETLENLCAHLGQRLCCIFHHFRSSSIRVFKAHRWTMNFLPPSCSARFNLPDLLQGLSDFEYSLRLLFGIRYLFGGLHIIVMFDYFLWCIFKRDPLLNEKWNMIKS